MPTLSINARRILKTIWQSGPISRSGIAELVGLNVATVTRVTRDLEKAGLVVDSVVRTGSRGQPSRPLVVAEDGAVAVGVNFISGQIEIALVNLGGQIIEDQFIEVTNPSTSEVANIVKCFVSSSLKNHSYEMDHLLGVGISVPGDFLSDKSLTTPLSTYAKLTSVDLHSVLSAEIPLPLTLENDANAAAAAENLYGAGVPYDNFYFIHLGEGLGSAHVIDGNLYRGSNGNAGGIGAFFPYEHSRPTAKDLVDNLSAQNVGVKTARDLFHLGDQAKDLVDLWIDRAGYQLWEKMHVLSRLLDPSAIIIGGWLPNEYACALVDRINTQPIYPPILPDSFPCPTIIPSTIKEHGGVIGAASLAISDALFDPDIQTLADHRIAGKA